jgi:hypothetical protein
MPKPTDDLSPGEAMNILDVLELVYTLGETSRRFANGGVISLIATVVTTLEATLNQETPDDLMALAQHMKAFAMTRALKEIGWDDIARDVVHHGMSVVEKHPDTQTVLEAAIQPHGWRMKVRDTKIIVFDPHPQVHREEEITPP